MRTTDPPTLMLVGNGPGEITGWVLPIARAVRQRSQAGVRLVLLLPPSQFSSGGEGRIAGASGLFDELIPPARTIWLALGLGTFSLTRPAALLHLGGDLWVSRRLAARWSVPAFAYVETPLIVRHQRAFQRIFVAAEAVAGRLTAAGVDPSRLFVSGDPRLDDLPRRDATAEHGRPHVVLLAGSREGFFRVLFPLWAETALALRALAPEVSLTVAASPHLPVESVDAALAPWREQFARASITFRLVEAPAVMAEADLVITIPGTTTMQVAAAPVAALVVVPLQSVGGVPTEGFWHWLVSIPLLGPAIKQALAPGYVKRQGFVSLPNRLTGRAILPEVIGRVEPAALARTAAALLQDPAARRRIEDALAEAAGPRGAAARIADQMLAAVALRPPRVAVG